MALRCFRKLLLNWPLLHYSSGGMLLQQVTENGKRRSRNEEQGTVNLERGTENGERRMKMKNGERRTENKEWETGNGSLGPRLQFNLLMTVGSKGSEHQIWANFRTWTLQQSTWVKNEVIFNGFYLNFYLQVHSSYSMIVGYYLRVKNSRMRIVTDISKNGFVYLRKTDTSTTVKLSSLEDLQWVASQSRAKYYCLDDMIIRNKLQWSCVEIKRKRGPVNYYCASYFTLNLEVTWLSIMGSLIILSLLIGGRNLDKLNSLYD